MIETLKVHHKGMEDGWRYAQQLSTMPIEDIEKAFHSRSIPYILRHHTVDEFVEIFENFEQEKLKELDTIEIGDELRYKHTDQIRVIVMGKPGGKYYTCLNKAGQLISEDINKFEPTGKKYPQIKEAIESLNKETSDGND